MRVGAVCKLGALCSFRSDAADGPRILRVATNLATLGGECKPRVGTILMWLVALVVWRNARLARDRERILSQLEQLHGAAERAANAERIELSRWLHEGLAQELAAVGWALARHAADEIKIQTEAGELRTVINSALRNVHRKAVELRKLENEPGGLPVLVDRYVAEFTGRTGLSVEVSGTKCLESVPMSYAIVCLKVVQEVLTNVAKHASASRVQIECREEPRAVRVWGAFQK
jgi:signal transduction histidine kinase